MKKLFLFLLALSASVVSSFAQDVNKYLTDIQALYDQNIPRDQWTLTMINSAGMLMFNGNPTDPSVFQIRLHADFLNKKPNYLVIIADVPTSHEMFQFVVQQYVDASTTLRKNKKPTIYYGKYIPAPPKSPEPEIEVLDAVMTFDDEPETIEIVEMEDDAVYIVADEMPEFIGGTAAMYDYIRQNLKYPSVAKENNIEGRVVCQFVVEKDGRLTNFQIVRSSRDPSLDREAMRVIRSFPKWRPGKIKGKTVRVKFTVPVTFKL